MNGATATLSSQAAPITAASTPSAQPAPRRSFANEYSVLQVIEQSSTGGVVRATRKSNNVTVIAKYLVKSAYAGAKSKASAYERLRWEAYGMSQMRHSTIVNVIDLVNDHSTDRVYLIIENCEDDLFTACFQGEGETLPEACATAIFTQLLGAVTDLHKHRIAHRDIKFENVFYQNLNESPDRSDLYNPERVGNVIVKLGDFGLWCQSRDAETSKVMHHHAICGSDVYGAPEQTIPRVQGPSGYDAEKCDIYSLGVVMFALYLGFPPWASNQSATDPYNLLWMHGAVGSFWQVVDHHTGSLCSKEFKDLFTRMCNPDPAVRPSIEEVWAHPFITGSNEDKVQEFPADCMCVSEASKRLAAVVNDRAAQHAEAATQRLTAQGP